MNRDKTDLSFDKVVGSCQVFGQTRENLFDLHGLLHWWQLCNIELTKCILAVI
jgi:hypothetical protein